MDLAGSGLMIVGSLPRLREPLLPLSASEDILTNSGYQEKLSISTITCLVLDRVLEFTTCDMRICMYHVPCTMEYESVYEIQRG